MGNVNAKGTQYAIATAVACIAFYAIPVGLVGNQAGLFLTPVMNEFGWSQTDASCTCLSSLGSQPCSPLLRERF